MNICSTWYFNILVGNNSRQTRTCNAESSKSSCFDVMTYSPWRANDPKKRNVVWHVYERNMVRRYLIMQVVADMQHTQFKYPYIDFSSSSHILPNLCHYLFPHHPIPCCSCTSLLFSQFCPILNVSYSACSWSSSIGRFPFTFPSSNFFCIPSCLTMWPKYLMFFTFKILSISLPTFAFLNTVSLVTFFFYEIVSKLLIVHISNASMFLAVVPLIVKISLPYNKIDHT